MGLPFPPRMNLRRWAQGEDVVPEAESYAPAPQASDLLLCPACGHYAPVDGPACPHCGFPFSCALAQPDREVRAYRMEWWRVLLGCTALAMLLTSGIFMQDGADTYNGLSFTLLHSLKPANSGIAMSGPDAFFQRTELALGVIKQRAPEFYWRIQDNIERIDSLSTEELNSPAGRRVRMEGIGAMATPSTRRVQVLPTTAFPYGEEANDRALYSYAATLVHELRHIELHHSGQAPGGWQEEALCEEAALAFLERAAGPPALILEKRIYLANPTAPRYQHWYKWYEQFGQ